MRASAGAGVAVGLIVICGVEPAVLVGRDPVKLLFAGSGSDEARDAAEPIALVEGDVVVFGVETDSGDLGGAI